MSQEGRFYLGPQEKVIEQNRTEDRKTLAEVLSLQDGKR